MSEETYLETVRLFLAVDALDEYSRRLCLFYHSCGIPPSIAVRQILDYRQEAEMSKPIYESMTAIECGTYKVRVWGKAVSFDDAITHRADIVVALQRCVLLKDIQKTLDRLPRIAAYEITVADGRGVVVYKEWP